MITWIVSCLNLMTPWSTNILIICGCGMLLFSMLEAIGIIAGMICRSNKEIRASAQFPTVIPRKKFKDKN